jgi:hypothetical protein
MNKEISPEKYSHIFFLEKGELYRIGYSSITFIDYKTSIEDLISVDVKSWKPYTVAHNKDDNEWFISNESKDILHSAYLGVKTK